MRKLRSDSKLRGCLHTVISEYNAGLSLTDLSVKYGLDTGNLYRSLVMRGVPIRTKSEALRNAIRRGQMDIKRGAAHHSWRGGIAKHSKGYRLVRRPTHPCADSRGYVFEHRLVAEQKIGRPLEDNEVVHHLNHVRDDNRPENLEVMLKSEHSKLHAEETDGYIGINHRS